MGNYAAVAAAANYGAEVMGSETYTRRGDMAIHAAAAGGHVEVKMKKVVLLQSEIFIKFYVKF